MKKKLTKEEKLKLHRELAGSASKHSAEGIKESLEIASRSDWNDNEWDKGK